MDGCRAAGEHQTERTVCPWVSRLAAKSLWRNIDKKPAQAGVYQVRKDAQAGVRLLRRQC